MPKIETIQIKGYYFIGYDGLYFHSGKFWINDTEVKQVYNNGSKSVLLGNSKKSIKQLRKVAQHCIITLYKEQLPF